MRGKVLVVGLMLSVLMIVSANAGLSVGAKVWVPELTIGVAGEEATLDGFAVGPQASIDLGDTFWISGSWLVGAFDFPDGDTMTSQDAEAVLAMSLNWFDVGVGFRYSVDSFSSDEDEAVKMGPMVYVGLGDTFGDTALGWYAAGSWMFYDINDDWGDNGGKHYNAEAGLSLYLEPLTATVGYRYKDHYDVEDEGLDKFDYKGFTATAGLTF